MNKYNLLSIIIAIGSWVIFIFIASLFFDANTMPKNKILLIVISILAYTVYKITYDKLKKWEKNKTK